MIADDITAFLKDKFGGYEIRKKFVLLQENFSLENGSLTQTMNRDSERIPRRLRRG